MNVRKAEFKDFGAAEMLLEIGRRNIAALNIDQWQNGDPSAEDLKRDIENRELYLCEKDGAALGMAYIGTNGEPTYKKIYEGAWLQNGAFTVIHRVAVDSAARGKGVFAALVQKAKEISKESGISALRIDTHRGNIPMQHALKKQGFSYCGIIFLESGDERLAYEKLL
mgnify:CR=1 FL=1